MIRRSFRRATAELRAVAIRASLSGRFDERSILAITSSPRSGSTWLANLLRSIPDSCVLFEPLHLVEVPQAKAAGFSWRTHVPPADEWPSGEAFLRRVFAGKVANAWTTREMSFDEARRATTLIIKFVRANRLLPWMCRRFQLRTPILLIRHPCAVVASQLRFREWKRARRPAAPPYIANLPAFRTALENTQGVEEHLAAAWALDLLPALMEQPPHPWLLVPYEELFLQPATVLTRIRDACGLPLDVEAALARIRMPSSVVHETGISGVDGWQRQLTGEQVSRILRTVRAFGLDFYTQEPEPDYAKLRDGVVRIGSG